MIIDECKALFDYTHDRIFKEVRGEFEGMEERYKRPKRKDYQRLQIDKITQLECRVESLKKMVEQLKEKNMQLRIANNRCNGLFGTFMCKCIGGIKQPHSHAELWDILNKIYLLSRKILEEIK